MNLLVKTIVCVVISTVGGFMFNDPCFIDPQIHDQVRRDTGWSQDAVYEARVPVNCVNGTMDWNYPHGHVFLYFNNNNTVPTSVCISNWLGGEVFTITDVTNGRHQQLGNFTARDHHYECTVQTTSAEIVLKFDAPGVQRYMGGVNYLVKH